MKLTKYFMPLAAVALLASCSNDKLDGPAENGGVNGEGGEPIYVTMKISQSLSTRTATPDQGIEVGTSDETKIGSALLIFTPENAHTVSAAAITQADGFELVGSNGQYAASFKMLKDELQAQNYKLYVIANPTTTITGLFLTGNSTNTSKKNQSIQDVFSLASVADTYWTAEQFLMSSAAEPDVITITADDLAAGAHSTKATALQLGDVAVQRAMSRFDIAANNLVYNATGNNPNLNLGEGATGVQITIDGASLVNQSSVANLFKVGGNSTGWSNWLETPQQGEGNSWNFFKPETVDNYVFSPSNKTYLNPLFTATTKTAGGVQKDLKDLPYSDISNTQPDNTEYIAPENPPTGSTDINYFVWKYCMENTIQAASGGGDGDQKKGITTAIVFRAKLEGGAFASAAGDDVYAYGNTIIGTEDAFENYEYDEDYEESMSEDDINKIIAIRHHQAEKDKEEGKYDTMDKALVANGFTIYRAENVEGTNQYHCYYVYYNRHNDNGNLALMGPMEFATVRNNVYKLWIKTIKSLGHPGTTEDDPDPEDPDDPDESTEFWCELAVKVLPWEVRINAIEF